MGLALELFGRIGDAIISSSTSTSESNNSMLRAMRMPSMLSPMCEQHGYNKRMNLHIVLPFGNHSDHEGNIETSSSTEISTCDGNDLETHLQSPLFLPPGCFLSPLSEPPTSPPCCACLL
eukprot:4044132-Amphidinium_carterae.4